MLNLNDIFSSTNPVFSGGFGLAVLAASAQILRTGANASVSMMKRHFLITLEITSKDRSYPWVLQWLYSRGNMTQHLSVETTTRQSANNTSNVKIDFVPGTGRHFLNYKGRFMIVQRIREQQMLDLNSGKPWEKIQFTSFGRSTTVFESILLEAFELCTKQEEGKTIIFTNWGSEWRQFGLPRKKRSVESVILDKGLSEHLLNDITEWQNSSAWYNDRGIPYRRGYLFHGPPGSGKSSLIMSLAGKLGYNICILNLAERGLTDERLALALSTVPPQSIVLLEDIDAAFPSRENNNNNNYMESSSSFKNTVVNNYSSDVTFSGLLNVLDGVASSEERLIFMTTNYIDRLDSALIRPGRVDYVQLIDDATDHQVGELFQKFFPNVELHLVEQFKTDLRIAKSAISMATLQGYLLRYKNDPIGACNGLQQLKVSNIIDKKLPTSENTSVSSDENTQNVKSNRRPVKRLSIQDVDRIPFNPQEGWDSGIKEI